MRIANIAVFVSGGGTNLGALLEAEKNGIIKSGRITLVLSNKEGVYALERAKAAGVESVTVLKKDFKSQADFEERIIAILKEKNIDLIVLAGFLSILSEGFTSAYKDRIINVHPSLIPSFCGKGYYGLAVHKAALEKGVKVSGATVHFVNEVPDGGKIIMQKAVSVLDSDTPESLQRRIMEEAEWQILPLATELVAKELINKNAN